MRTDSRKVEPNLSEKSVWDLANQAEMLDRMEVGPDACW